MGDHFSAEILTIGSEILKGSVLNLNAQFLGKELTAMGFRVRAQSSCDDVQHEIGEHLLAALRRAHLIIMTGGLGPTPDDVTRECLADFYNVKLELSKAQLARIRGHYRRHGKKMPAIVRKEACFPGNATPLINRHGIALGFYIKDGDSLVVVLPGVPAELKNMMNDSVRALIRRHFKTLARRPSLVVKTVGLSESGVMVRLGQDFFKEDFDFGIYPHPGEVCIRIYAKHAATIRRCAVRAKKKLGRFIYALQDDSLESVVGTILRRRKATIAVAESCTGGLLASTLTSVSKASQYMLGGVVAYNNRVKERDLGVSRDTLRQDGAVSEATARAMAKGVRLKMQSTYGVGITGIAGPTGGSRSKPVGLVYIAVADRSRQKVWKHNLWGERPQVQRRATAKALEHIWRWIK